MNKKFQKVVVWIMAFVMIAGVVATILAYIL